MSFIYTIGHSTRPFEDFVSLLIQNDVEQLVDIRSIPRSRHNPQYEQSALRHELPARGIAYVYLEDLGGLRPKAKDSINTAWRNQSFRNYADYMQTSDFAGGIDKLMELAAQKTTAIMCAEAVPWRCHRSLVGDALLARGVEVRDIMDDTHVKPHTFTSFAHVSGKNVTYPDPGRR